MIPHETIKYSNNLPFSADFINVLDEPVHCHREIEILLVLRGFCRYKIYHTDYTLQLGDMIIADVEDLHRIHHSSEDVLLLQLHLDTKKFEEIYPNISSTYFVCEDPGAVKPNEVSHLGKRNTISFHEKQILLHHQLAKLMMDRLGNPSDFVLHTDNINEILSTLVRHFRGFYMEGFEYRAGRDDVSEIDLDRMSRITSYLLKHYDRKVTLEEIANTEHLNPYYVSHLIKKTLGISFQHFLNGVRLEFAEKNLLFSNQTLIQVSESSGFSSLNYFNKCFHDWYGYTPSQYRKSISQTSRIVGPSYSIAEALELTGKFLTPVVSIQKLTLQMENQLVNHATNAESLRPKIQISTQEDLLGLGFLRERILAIKPVSFHVSRRLLTPVAYSVLQTFGLPIEPMDVIVEPASGPSAQNTALALAQIAGQAKNPKLSAPIPLFGPRDALFLQEGLATPHYTAFQLLSGLCGVHLFVSSREILSHSENELTILLYNPDPRAILNVKLETKNLPAQFVLMKKQIPEENNCYTILEALGNPTVLPVEVIREIDQSHLGVPHFLMVEKAVSPVLDFMVYPQHVTLLTISTIFSHS